MTIVLLVRHGRTAANRRGILAGRQPGIPLDSHGRRQASGLAARLRQVPVDVIAHSPLERCVETAHALVAGRGSADGNPALVCDERLLECDYGSWSGGSISALVEDPLWAQVQKDPGAVTFPGGESMAAMAQRAVAAMEDWAERVPDGVVVLVSHGDPIKAMLSHALAQPFAQFQRILVSPGSVSVVALGPARTVVLGMNLTSGRLRLPPRPPASTLGGGPPNSFA